VIVSTAFPALVTVKNSLAGRPTVTFPNARLLSPNPIILVVAGVEGEVGDVVAPPQPLSMARQHTSGTRAVALRLALTGVGATTRPPHDRARDRALYGCVTSGSPRRTVSAPAPPGILSENEHDVTRKRPVGRGRRRSFQAAPSRDVARRVRVCVRAGACPRRV
jgi:hypothetical protein